MNYKENQEGVLISELTYPKNTPLGRFGKLAVENLKQQDRAEYVIKMMNGTLMDYGHQMENNMWTRINELENQYEKYNPLTKEQQQDVLTATRIRNQYRLQATEVAMKELMQ
uniref:TnpV protein n=1 Tax=Enterococcus faecalis TaxID=1351 RepID=UPI000413BB20